MIHSPVMLEEALSHLHLKADGVYVDMTVGAGGHACAILGAVKDAHLICIDRDEAILSFARERLESTGGRYSLHCARSSQIDSVLNGLKISRVDGLLWDMGVSSLQLDDGRRGFSFSREGPLDMRMGKDCSTTAQKILETFSEGQLADLIFEYGEESRSRKIARAIVDARRLRPIKSTLELAGIIARIYGPNRGHIHPATKVFQALRIAVNEELGELEVGLKKALDFLAPGGTMVVIAFHSLEDRIVKNFFRSHQDVLDTVTRKPVLPDRAEYRRNPRSRSAKLRSAVRRP